MNNSKQRNLILEIINTSTSHPSANMIYEIARKTIPNISLGTVYRNLNFLLEHGMIKKLKTNGKVCRYDRIFNIHNHFVCSKCGEVFDIFDDEVLIPKEMSGHMINNCEINYTGICANCISSLENKI